MVKYGIKNQALKGTNCLQEKKYKLVNKAFEEYTKKSLENYLKIMLTSHVKTRNSGTFETNN